VAGRDAQSARRAPHRGRSQHFLRSPALAEAIVRDAAVPRDAIVVDVGAGTGRLTAPLAERAAGVYAIEVDPVSAAHLRRRFGTRSNVTVVEGDALRAPLPHEPFRVVANLPFAGATAILRRLLDHPSLEQADVIVEWDVARKRASCWPSTLLGVCWGVRYEFRLVRRLPPACFEPPPHVDAGLLRIVARDIPLVLDRDYPRFRRFVGAAFAGNGRALRATLGGRAFKRAAREVGVGASARPRELDVYQWVALFAAERRAP
jgi:23S rRNA (adenine-N6)-dimethyltransferase